MALASFSTGPFALSHGLVFKLERSQAKAWEFYTADSNLVSIAAQKVAPMRASRWIEKELFRGSSKGSVQRPHILLSHRRSQFTGDTFELTQPTLESSGQSVHLRIGYRIRVVEASNRFHGNADSPRHVRIRRLNQLYNRLEPSNAADAQRSKSQTGLVNAPPDDSGLLWSEEKSSSASLIDDLPLCFVPWALLPGSQEMLHVFEPHHVHLFETILAQPQPWRYGHMLASPGRRQHLIGAVAEILEVERFSDGRMLLLVSATAKIRVLRPSQKVPFVCATVERERDEEESLVEALYPGLEGGLGKPSANKNGVRSSGPEWDPEVAAAAVMTHELRRREKELWDCYDQVRLLTAKLRVDGRVIPPPSALLALLPPGRSPAPNSSPRPRSVEQKWEDPGEVVARVQRLSYTVGAVLPDVKRADGRQAFLEASSIRERMDLAADLMTQRCKELAARVAVKQALADTSTNLGS